MHTVHVVLVTNSSYLLMQRWASIVCGLQNANAGESAATSRLAGAIVMIWPVRVHSLRALHDALTAMVALEAGVLGVVAITTVAASLGSGVIAVRRMPQSERGVDDRSAKSRNTYRDSCLSALLTRRVAGVDPARS